MKVISYMAFGCIFKIKAKHGFEIESVKIKCISPKYGSDWMDVKRKNNEISNDGCEDVYYELKDLDEETTLLKIEHLPAPKKYRIELQTNQSLYMEDVTIHGEDLCTHITNIDDAFITFIPPLGQINCPQHGLHEYFVKESSQLTTRISNGAQLKIMTVKEFAEFSDDYRIRNFPNNKNVLLFPLLDMISDPVIKQVANLFYQLLFDRHGFRAVVTNLDFNKYLQCCTETVNILHTDLPYRNRILVFDQETESVLNVRVLQQTSFDGDVHKEMEHCITDMQYFVAANRHHSSCCYVIGILAFPNICRADLKSQLSYYFSKQNQSLLNLFYLSREDLQHYENYNSLQQWWTDVFEIKIKGPAKSNFKVNSFQRICSQSMCTIALAKLPLKLPTLSSDAHLQINSLLLNPNQVKAIQTISNRKIIIGNFGSGKTVVLDEIAKMKFRECLRNVFAKKKSLLLYVVWEAYSLLEIQKKLFLENLNIDEPNYSPHLTMISGNVHGLWAEMKKGQPISLLQFFQYYLQESGFDILHILIDELPTDAVHVKELETLNKLLSRHPNSSVTIAPQSIVVDRTTSTKTEDKNHNRNCLDQIEMDRFVLVKVMRNSKQVTATLKASQDKLHGTETVLNVYDPVLNVYDPVAEKVGLLTKFKKKVKNGVSQFKTVFTTQQASNSALNVTKERTEPTGPETNVSTSIQSQKPITEPPIELETISKFMDTEENEKEAISQLKTTYQFHAIENGNGVTDQKPTLIKLPSEVDFECDISAKILTVTLKKLCLNESASTLMLCSSMEEIRMVSYCLSLIPNFKFVTYIPQLQGVFPTIEERKSAYLAFNDGSCLLTDNTGIKGMEAKRVIIFAQHDEYFQSHLINETMSRANVWAYILLRSPTPTVKKNRKTLGDILEELETFGLFNVKQVTLYENHSDFDAPFHNEDDQIFKVNKICPLNLHGRPTFDAYRTLFDHKFPVHQTAENYRMKLQELTSFHKYEIFHSIQYEGKTFRFDDIYYDSLYENDFDRFFKLFQDNPFILNNFRDRPDVDNQSTFLMKASMRNHPHIVEYLLQQFRERIDLLAVDVSGRNAYHIAASRGNIDIMKMLLVVDGSNGLNVRNNNSRMTPLHYAAEYDSKRMVEFLLDAGADVDGRYNASDEIKSLIEKHRKK